MARNRPARAGKQPLPSQDGGGSQARPYSYIDGVRRPEARAGRPPLSRAPSGGTARLGLSNLDLEAMEGLAVSLGQPRFRGRQLFEWVHGRLEVDLSRMSNLPRGFVRQLAALQESPGTEAVQELLSADGMTRKTLLPLADGQRVEIVLMESASPGHEADRYTVCVSSQVGCALGCAFCVTGQSGFARQLSAGEILEQVYRCERSLRNAAPSSEGQDRRFITNVVFMGMGEPLANYEAVVAAVRLLVSPHGLGLGARRITISTAGLVPGIDRLAGEGLQLGLAISLHAASDQIRERLMPVNRRYPVAQVVQAADRYSEKTGRRVTYECTLIQGVNDANAHAWQLAHLLSGRLCHVNLIPLNQSLDSTLKPSAPERVLTFQKVLEEGRIPCTLRQSKGQDILAACGQLRYTAARKC